MVARQASNTATSRGMDAPCRATLFRQPAETDATSKPISSAWSTDCFWPGDWSKPAGIAAACRPEASCPERNIRSPNSSDRDAGSMDGVGRISLSVIRHRATSVSADYAAANPPYVLATWDSADYADM